MSRIVLLIGTLALVLSASNAEAGLIVPVSASGTGSFSNSPTKLIDGVLPPRWTGWLEPTNVFWYGDAPAFTIDFGGVYWVENLIADVDNNDDYFVSASLDGISFTPLFTFLTSDGLVPGGMDILTTNSSYPALPGDLTTPAYVGRQFAPIEARFLRVSGQAGDGRYAIGEIQAFGIQAVPEPASLTMLALGSLTLVSVWRFKFTSHRPSRS